MEGAGERPDRLNCTLIKNMFRQDRKNRTGRQTVAPISQCSLDLTHPPEHTLATSLRFQVYFISAAAAHLSGRQVLSCHSQ